MTGDASNKITLRIEDDVIFRLREGRRPLVFPDMSTRVSYETGIHVIHAGEVWAIGLVDDAEALELDDGTVVLAADIDPKSLAVGRADS